ncbi:MAG: HAD hydrolase-like protein [Candidatus Moraniibacteriota bacterium]
MEQKIILFDFDGTIADTFPIFLTFASQEGFRSDPDQIDELRNLSMLEVVRRLKIPNWKIPFFAWKFHRYFGKVAGSVRMIEGMAATIRLLRENGYMLGIVTSNSVPNVKKILDRENLVGCFDIIRSERNVFGKARTLKDVTRRLDADPKTVWYVGDEVRDVEAAREAGLRVASVCWGFNAEAILRAANPDRLTSRPEELPGLFC